MLNNSFFRAIFRRVTTARREGYSFLVPGIFYPAVLGLTNVIAFLLQAWKLIRRYKGQVWILLLNMDDGTRLSVLRISCRGPGDWVSLVSTLPAQILQSIICSRSCKNNCNLNKPGDLLMQSSHARAPAGSGSCSPVVINNTRPGILLTDRLGRCAS